MSPLEIAREALKKAERQFLSYAEHHAAKGTAEAAEKAMVNIRMVDKMLTAAETRGWNAAIDAAVDVMVEYLGHPENGYAVAQMRCLSKPEGTPND